MKGKKYTSAIVKSGPARKALVCNHTEGTVHIQVQVFTDLQSDKRSQLVEMSALATRKNMHCWIKALGENCPSFYTW